MTAYSLIIRSVLPGDDDAPEIVRLRTALKMIYRACGFRCLEIRPQDPEFSDGDGI